MKSVTRVSNLSDKIELLWVNLYEKIVRICEYIFSPTPFFTFFFTKIIMKRASISSSRVDTMVQTEMIRNLN